MKKRTIMLLFSFSIMLSACGKSQTAGNASTENPNLQTAETTQSTDAGEAEALITMPEACYEPYTITNVPTLSGYPEYEWLDANGQPAAATDMTRELVVNPLGITMEHSALVEKVKTAAPFIEETAEEIQTSYQYNWEYETDESGAKTVGMTGFRDAAYYRSDEGKSALQTLLHVNYNWNSSISNDPIGLDISISPGEQGIMTAKEIVKNSLTDTLYQELIEVMLDGQPESGQQGFDTDETSPRKNEFLIAYNEAELRTGSERLMRTEYMRNAYYPTGPYAEELFPELSVKMEMKIEDGEDVYRSFESGLPRYDQIMSENKSPINPDSMLSSISLLHDGQAYWDILNQYALSGGKLSISEASCSAANYDRKKEGNSAIYDFEMVAEGIVQDSYAIGGNVDIQISEAADGLQEITSFSMGASDIIETEAERNPTEADMEKAAQTFCNIYKEALPELAITPQEFKEKITENETELTSIVSKEIILGGQTIPVLAAITVKLELGIEVNYSVFM